MSEIIQFKLPAPKLQAKPIADICRWSEAFETVTTSNLRVMFAWQRIILRSIWGL